MSYDISIADCDFNYTSNVSALFYDHIPKDRSRGGLSELDGLSGRAACRVIGLAFDRMHESYLQKYDRQNDGARSFRRQYDAPNGWGSTIGALLFLSRIMAACEQHPRHKVSVCA